MATASETRARAHRTRDHDTIRRWAELRGGRPARIGDTEILRIEFREPDAKLKPMTWEEFFRVFDERDIEFLYQDQTRDGVESRFFKFVGNGGDSED